MTVFVKKTKGPPTIKAMSSNTLSDSYRDAITIAYQYVGSTVPEIAFSFCGKNFETPIMAGPVGFPHKSEEDHSDVIEYARAVSEAGSVYWATFHNPVEWAKILKEKIPALRVIKPLADLERLAEEIRFDTENGALGYAMDIDHGLNAYGELDQQKEAFAPKTLADLKFLSEASPLPFFVKGILTAHDALLCAEAGVSGIVISGHNNRFPCAVPALKALPEIRQAVGDKLTILVDGGMTSGYDAFKALALGADGVLAARTLSAAFVKDGAEGLCYRLREMTAELKGAMANTGSPDLAHINRAAIRLP